MQLDTAMFVETCDLYFQYYNNIINDKKLIILFDYF